MQRRQTSTWFSLLAPAGLLCSLAAAPALAAPASVLLEGQVTYEATPQTLNCQQGWAACSKAWHIKNKYRGRAKAAGESCYGHVKRALVVEEQAVALNSQWPVDAKTYNAVIAERSRHLNNHRKCLDAWYKNNPIVLQGRVSKDIEQTGTGSPAGADHEEVVSGKILWPRNRVDKGSQPDGSGNSDAGRQSDSGKLDTGKQRDSSRRGTGNKTDTGKKPGGANGTRLKPGIPQADQAGGNNSTGNGAQKVVTGKIIKKADQSLPADKKYIYGQPQPMLAFADGATKAWADCEAYGLAMAGLGKITQKYRAFTTVVNALCAASAMGGAWETYEQYRDNWPQLSDYQRGYLYGKEVCQGVSLVKAGKGLQRAVLEARADFTPASLSAATGKFTPPSALQRGLTLDADKKLRGFANRNNKIVIVRDSNPAAMRWAGQPGYKPKPAELKGKTIPADPNKPLSQQPHAGLASAKGMSGKDLRTLKQLGYRVTGRDRIITDADGNRFYSDTDLHGVYNSDGSSAWNSRMRQQLNNHVGDNIVQHGPHDEWALRNSPGKNFGPQPPATAYMPDSSVWHLENATDLKWFYKMQGMEWSRIYPHH